MSICLDLGAGGSPMSRFIILSNPPASTLFLSSRRPSSSSFCTRSRNSSSSLCMAPFSQNQIDIASDWLSAAEVPASEAASASCYDFAEHIVALAVIVAKLKLGEIERQILLADVVVSADDSTLQQRPERLDIVGMYLAAYVLERLVVHALVRICLIQLVISRAFIRGDQRRLCPRPRCGRIGSSFQWKYLR